MRTPNPKSSVATELPWVPVEIAGRPYQIRSYGSEHAFEVDAWLLHVLGDSAAAMIASGLEGVLPAMIVSVAEEFDGLETIDEVKAEIAAIMDGQLRDKDVLEFIGRICGAVAPKVSDLIREVLPTAFAKLDGRVVKDMVRLCLFDCLMAQDPNGQWYTVSSWQHLDMALAQLPRGPKRQAHKWLLLLRAIQVTWGPSGPADPTHPGDERAADTGPLH
jgi:hypothetical protein